MWDPEYQMPVFQQRKRKAAWERTMKCIYTDFYIYILNGYVCIHKTIPNMHTLFEKKIQIAKNTLILILELRILLDIFFGHKWNYKMIYKRWQPPKKNWPFSHMKHLRFSSIDNQRERKERKERVGEDKCRKEGTEKREGKEVEFKNRQNTKI